MWYQVRVYDMIVKTGNSRIKNGYRTRIYHSHGVYRMYDIISIKEKSIYRYVTISIFRVETFYFSFSFL